MRVAFFLRFSANSRVSPPRLSNGIIHRERADDKLNTSLSRYLLTRQDKFCIIKEEKALHNLYYLNKEALLFTICLLLWLIFSLRISVEIAVAGAVISVAAYQFARRHLRYKKVVINRKLLRNLRHGLRYAAILIFEIAKANFIMFKLVFSREIEINPQLKYFRTNLRANSARVVLANSITLTPGTITVALNDDLFCVHCLNAEMAEGIEDSVFVRQLQRFEE